MARQGIWFGKVGPGKLGLGLVWSGVARSGEAYVWFGKARNEVR